MYHQFNIQQFYVLPTHCIYVFCVNLRTNSHYSPYNINCYCGFESRWCLIICVLRMFRFVQTEVSALGRSLVQKVIPILLCHSV